MDLARLLIVNQPCDTSWPGWLGPTILGIWSRIEAKRVEESKAAGGGNSRSSSAAPQGPKGAGRQPYKGTGRWSRLLKVSTLQRSIQIWSFALVFAVKYLLLSRKFSYGKKVLPPRLRYDLTNASPCMTFAL